MRKLKRINNKQFGICVTVLITLVCSQAGINKIRNAEAEEKITPQRIFEYQIQERNITIPSRSVYIESENIVNIYPEEIVSEAPVTRPEYNLNLSEECQDLIYDLCIKNDISYEFVLAVFHYESMFNSNATNKNRDNSMDIGVSQLNNYYTDTHKMFAIKYCELSENAKFNMFNPDHNIRAGVGTLVNLRDYWKQKGVSDNQMLEYITGSYNLGLYGFEQYIKRTGKIEREYSRQVQKRKNKLGTTHTL